MSTLDLPEEIKPLTLDGVLAAFLSTPKQIVCDLAGNMSQWTSADGEAVAVQATAARKPIYVRDAVHFNDEYLGCENIDQDKIVAANAMTVTVSLQIKQAPAKPAPLLSKGDFTDGHIYIDLFGNDIRAKIGSGALFVIGAVPAWSKLFTVTLVAANGVVEAFVDGERVKSVAYGAITANDAPYLIGGRWKDGKVSAILSGVSIKGVVLAAQAVTAADRERLETATATGKALFEAPKPAPAPVRAKTSKRGKKR